MASRSSIARPMRVATHAAKSGRICNAARSFTTTASRPKEVAGDAAGLPNMRTAARDYPKGPLAAPIVNPADKYQDKSQSCMHEIYTNGSHQHH